LDDDVSQHGICVCCCRLCVVLLTKKVAEHDAYRDSFRDFALEHSEHADRVRFTYVYEDTQSPFVKSVTWGRGAINDTLGSLKVFLFLQGSFSVEKFFIIIILLSIV